MSLLTVWCSVGRLLKGSERQLTRDRMTDWSRSSNISIEPAVEVILLWPTTIATAAQTKLSSLPDMQCCLLLQLMRSILNYRFTLDKQTRTSLHSSLLYL